MFYLLSFASLDCWILILSFVLCKDVEYLDLADVVFLLMSLCNIIYTIINNNTTTTTTT
jgi:hypothetical protein